MGGKPVLLIDLLSAVFGLTTVFLAGRNNKSNFYVGYVYTALLFFMFWQKNLYANLILQPISLGINILGQYRWSHPKKSQESSSGSGELKVSMLTWPQRGLIVGHICIDITPMFKGEKCNNVTDLLVPGKLINVGAADIHTGGSVANTGLAMKLMGADVSLMGKVGDDEFGC